MADETNARVAVAEANVQVARARLEATLHEIAHRLRPATIANDAAENAKLKAKQLADDAGSKAKALASTATDRALDQPVATGAGAALIAGFFSWRLLRHRKPRSPKSQHQLHSNQESEDHGRYEDSLAAGRNEQAEPVVAHG